LHALQQEAAPQQKMLLLSPLAVALTAAPAAAAVQ
jgi:hypothetical protein